MKDNETIFTMEEKKIEKAGYQKIFSATDKMPQNLHIKDECGELTRGGHCDNDKAKFKYVILTFYNIEEDSFGFYTITNSIGNSKPIYLVETIDGKWSSWSTWSSCSKTCLRYIFNMTMNMSMLM